MSKKKIVLPEKARELFEIAERAMQVSKQLGDCMNEVRDGEIVDDFDYLEKKLRVLCDESLATAKRIGAEATDLLIKFPSTSSDGRAWLNEPWPEYN